MEFDHLFDETMNNKPYKIICTSAEDENVEYLFKADARFFIQKSNWFKVFAYDRSNDSR